MTVMIAALKRLNDVLVAAINAVILFLLAVMVVVVALQIASRLLSVSLIWTTEVTQFLLVWLTFLGMPTVYRSGGHIAVELFIGWLPEGLRFLEERLVHLLLAAFFVIFSVVAADFIWTIRWSRAATINISMVWPYLAIPTGSVLSAFFALEMAFGPRRPREQESVA